MSAAPPAVPSVWSAPVRYAECDQQGVVFNAHYLLWCDEALAAFCTARDLPDLAAAVRVATSTLTWRAPVRHGDTVDVAAQCTRIGRTSFDLDLEIRAGDRLCCSVTTVYVNADADGTPAPLSADVRRALS